MARTWSILLVIALVFGSPAVAMGWTRCFCGPKAPVLPVHTHAPACCALSQAVADAAADGAATPAAIPSLVSPCDCGCGAKSAPEEARRLDPLLPLGGPAPWACLDAFRAVRLLGWTATARVWTPASACESLGPPCAAGRTISQITSVRLT